ncbi:tRNA uridine-5-carboxymethylaminomethyl(34) synthesis GTPase MnmE [Sphingorhabdus arenilitoris]|uniref:tRNA modification GTPase MnmE n=1 Tax=Sphingorhabdus arenilitoris TaxID=1490041 RepID=A0ABV8RF30_9SPHN
MKNAATIFALSSGAPPSAIAIVRISGPAAFGAVKQLTGRKLPMRKPSLAKLYDPMDSTVLDQALVLLFPAPNSATGEDLAELHLHGGRAVVRAVEGVLGRIEGMRPALAGEFTRRAFLNGRIDLNEADGLSDLLSAETEWQRRSAVEMLGGAFSRAVEGWRTELLRISALTEAELDLSDEDDVSDQNSHVITDACIRLRREIDKLLARPAAEKLRDGLRIVLGGPPNSGKSTLLNALVERDAAIVSDIAGTTRDVIEVPMAIDGMAFIFTDTAGVRIDSDDAIENIGIEKAHHAFSLADMILWLGPEEQAPAHPNVIQVETKSDIAARQQKSAKSFWVSGKTGAGLSLLLADISRRAKTLLPPEDSYAVNMRQRALLADAAAALTEVEGIDDWLIIAEQLRLARLALDALTGRSHTEDLLDVVFGTFCVGK